MAASHLPGGIERRALSNPGTTTATARPLAKLLQSGIFLSAAGLLTNTANVASSETDLNLANNSASVVTTVNLPLADVGLTLSQPTNPIVIGSYLTNTISITNRGPGNALELALTNRLPAGFNFVSATSTLGAPAYNSGTVTCQFGTLAPNAGATVTVVVTPVVLGAFTNTAFLSTRSSDSGASHLGRRALATLTERVAIAR